MRYNRRMEKRRPGTLRRWGRRGCLAVLVFALLLVAAKPWIVSRIAGASHATPTTPLSPAARALVDRAFEGIDVARCVDFHTHVAGIGTGGSGCEVHPGMRSLLHPIRKVQFDVYLHASGVKDLENADREYVLRLVELIRGMGEPHPRNFILAFDRHYDEDGNAVPEETEFYVPNEYVVGLAREFPDCFLPAISVHPYREDALAVLDRYGEQGVRLVKWLPNAMGMDPASPRCDAFYERLARWDMILLSHCGEEQAVQAEEAQELGNPLRLRRALDHGVRVLAAHCGSSGSNLDDEGVRRSNFELFCELMEEERYEGLLFGEISTLTQMNRLGEPLLRILEREDWHPRLVNGSDYPLPAIHLLYQTRQLAGHGLIAAEERAPLAELYHVNPLLFDLVTKRTLRHPETGGSLPPSIFMLPEGWRIEWPPKGDAGR